MWIASAEPTGKPGTGTGFAAAPRSARHGFFRALVAAWLLLALAAPPALAQLSDLAAIRAAATEAAARSRALAAVAGPQYQARVLESVRRSCARRGVTRLDVIEPASVTSQAGETGMPALLELDASAEHVALSAVDNDSDVERSARGLVIRSGQVRTTAQFAIARERIGSIELEVATTQPGHLLVGWSAAADAPRLRRNNARVELVGDGRWHTYSIDAADALTRGIASGDAVRRFFVASRSAAPIELRALRVLPRERRYSGKAFGSGHESRGGELRSVLYARPPAALSFEVDVPADSPVFESGLATVATDAVMEFEVAVREGETAAVLLKRLVRPGPWEDVALDLAAWAGKHVTISLAVRGTREAVALWSSPLVRPRLGNERTEPFVVLLEDALRADHLSVYGGRVAAPAHERIAAAGIVFERAFAQATQTRSSVPSLMTSLLPSSNGTWDFSDSLSERYVTLAEVLRACGFATASFLQNGNAGAYAGLAQGFDVVFGEESSGDRAADLLAPGAKLAQWMARQIGRPYFAYVHVLDPHGPYDPAERPDLSAFGAEEELQRDRSIDAEWLERPTAGARRLLYEREVAANDRALGDFLDRFEAGGDLGRAVVAVIADHGEFLGEHGGLWRHHPPAHVEVARVPFLLRAPGVAPRRVSDPVGLFDLMPTLLELAGVDSSALVMHGSSLGRLLRGQSQPQRAIVGEEMILDAGERRPRGCGSFATSGLLWLLSCTRDEDFTPGRLLAVRSAHAAPLRIFDLGSASFGREDTPGSLWRGMLEGLGRRALDEIQAEGLAAWRRMTDAEAQKIVSEPHTAERLRALGYAE